ncbi:MAG: hypothetical protein ACRDYX_20715 [Egibacteraceae bacterium]
MADGPPLDVPYRITATGPAETTAKAPAIPGGAVDTLGSVPRVAVTMQIKDRKDRLEVAARSSAQLFRYGRPAVTPAPRNEE